MEQAKTIRFNNCEYFLKNGVLYEANTGLRINDKHYLFSRNYGTKPYDILVIKTTVFFIYPDKVEEIPSVDFEPEKKAKIFYTKGTGNKDGNGIYVFILRADQKPALIGRCLKKIAENAYKIGKIAYQIIDGHISELGPCAEYDFYRGILDIYDDESRFGKSITFKQEGGIWIKQKTWDPGTKPFRDFDICL